MTAQHQYACEACRARGSLIVVVGLGMWSPPIAIILWLGMVTSRRVSELLRLRWSDFYPQGGQESDHPHLLFHASPGEENFPGLGKLGAKELACLLYTSPSPRDKRQSRMPSSA